MYELTIEQFPAVHSLFTNLDHHLGALAVLAGEIPGRVLANDPAQPSAALICLKHRIYLAGSPDSEFCKEANHLLRTVILPGARAAGRKRFIIYPYPSASDWEAQAGILLQGIEHTQEQRLYLEFENLVTDWRRLLPVGFVLSKIDAGLLANTHLAGVKEIIRTLTTDRPSLENALQNEFGVCLIHKRKVASRCISEYHHNGRCEFGIATHSEFQRQGLATIAVAAQVEYALFSGVQRIGWHCWEKNRASKALAEKIGFEQQTRYPVWTGQL